MAAKVKIDEKLCKGCALCIAVCPNGSIFTKETVNEKGVNTAGLKKGYICKACMACVLICPDACIEIRK